MVASYSIQLAPHRLAVAVAEKSTRSNYTVNIPCSAKVVKVGSISERISDGLSEVLKCDYRAARPLCAASIHIPSIASRIVTGS